MNQNQHQGNYQKELDVITREQEKEGKVPRLLPHSCYVLCSSYVLEYLSQCFNITVYYYNPNISPTEEYMKRVKEQRSLIEHMESKRPVHLVAGAYESEEFHQVVKGLEEEPEGGARCMECYEMRLCETAKVAKAGGYDYFTTALVINPLKLAQKLNEIGETMGKEYGMKFLPPDFKEREGYKRSTQLSEEHGLYRQNYRGRTHSIRTWYGWGLIINF